ncbi:TPA: hypothetical protein ACW72T_005447 [Klebsiella pneumoniae]
MTDITELAQSLKAEDVSPARLEWLKKLADMEYCTSNPGHWLMSLKETNYLAVVALQCLEKNLALVEALEKAQQHIARQEQILLNQDESLSIRRGELEAAHQRIAELESHKAALLKFIRDSCYVFDGADEDISDAYVDAITSGLMPKLESVTACNPPLFWVRVKSDGGYEGPIHDSKLEEVRKKSGEWLPLTLAGGIPELESRTVTVKLPKDHVDDADLFGWGVIVVPLEALKEACTDAGVTVEITDAGVKVEAE